jgi:hypothetical protein
MLLESLNHMRQIILLMEMKSKIATRSLLIMALMSLFVIQVAMPVNAYGEKVHETTGQVKMYIYNTKAGKGTLVADTGNVTFEFFNHTAGNVTWVYVPVLKNNYYRSIMRNYGNGWGVTVDVEYPSWELRKYNPLRGSKQLYVYVTVDDLGDFSTLHFSIYIDPPAS